MGIIPRRRQKRSAGNPRKIHGISLFSCFSCPLFLLYCREKRGPRIPAVQDHEEAVLADNRFQRLYASHQKRVERRLAALVDRRAPASVYGPARYVLTAGGKRLRSVLVILSCEAVGGSPRRALDAAVAMEVLHNFTLVHDDVMDHAKVRRGRPTVHEKWDPAIAILAGDGLVAHAYRSLLKTRGADLSRVLDIFTGAFIGVCEGQGLDKEFEDRRDVSLPEYFGMIRKKTGRIMAGSAELGAVIGGGKPQQTLSLRRFGEELGIAFQIQDDLLDITGDEARFGKAIGGDVREGKKTYLLLAALRRASGSDRAVLESVARRRGANDATVSRVRRIYGSSGAIDAARREIARRTARADRLLDRLPASNSREALRWLSGRLLDRNS